MIVRYYITDLRPRYTSENVNSIVNSIECDRNAQISVSCYKTCDTYYSKFRINLKRVYTYNINTHLKQ